MQIRRPRYISVLVVLTALGCVVLTACGGTQSKAINAQVSAPTAAPIESSEAAKDAPALQKIEMQAPIIAANQKIASLDSNDFLETLYGDGIKLYRADAKTEYSADFRQSGVAKHVFITSLTAPQAWPILCVDIIEKHGQTYTIAEHYADVLKVVTQFSKSKLSWLQYGRDKFGLVELYETKDNEAKQDSPYSEVKLSARTGRGWASLLDVIQTAEAGEKVTQALSFVRGGREPWEGRIRTKFNQDKPLVVRYFYRINEYVPVGTIPKLTIAQAENVRGLPATDWDGTFVDLNRKKTRKILHHAAKFE
jgi:hypothetical protein